MSFKKAQKGFSLLELMVVIAIFLIITSVVMMDIPNFGRKGALDLTAQEVAGCFRSAQSYGNSRRVDETEGSVGAALSQNQILIFFDEDSSHYYDSGEGILSECSLNGYNLSFSEDIANAIFPSTDYKRTIKSNLEPEFYSPNGSPISSSVLKTTITSVRNSEQRCVFVYASGQITVGPCE